FKEEVIRTMQEEGFAYLETAERFGIRHKRVQIWERIYLEEGPESSAANVDAFTEKAKRCKTIEKLAPEIMHLFIAKIEIGELAAKYARRSV
ncbi:MAG: DUF4368 domain-containing protein, partial [Bacillota bacterium]|nr:DUF4368 domain-containing protein [Bacillota bacterium]